MIGPLPSCDVALVLRVGGDVLYSHGDLDRVFPLASVTKPIVAWSVLVAVERGLTTLDAPAGPPGSTVRHLLSHASGLPFEGRRPVAAPGKRRIYSNEGFDVLGELLEDATGMEVDCWVKQVIFDPLGMASAQIPGSPAYAGVASAADLSLFGAELARPTLVSEPLAALAAVSQFPALAGVVPGYGRFTPCPWGLGVEIRGEKAPHWSAPDASARTIGHFGQAGSFVWADRDLAASACFLGEEPFGQWHRENWSSLNASLLEMVRGCSVGVAGEKGDGSA